MEDGTTILIVRGSVLEQDVEAIVNAAHTAMRGGGGLDGAIHRAAGPALMEELTRIAPHGCPTGEVVVTGGHRLPFRHILHTPGPVWRGGGHGEDDLLVACYHNSLLAAERLGLASLAFPSISTGIYGFPLPRAAPLALATVAAHLRAPSSALRRVIFAMYGEEEYRVFNSASDTLRS